MRHKPITLPDAPTEVYELVAAELTAALEAEQQPQVIGFLGHNLKVSYPLVVDRGDWEVICCADFESAPAEVGSLIPGEPLRFLQLWAVSCLKVADDGSTTRYKFHPNKFNRFFAI